MEQIKIRMLKDVRPDFAFMANPGTILIAGHEYDATTNQHGAISGICANGEALGVKPGEFELIQAPEWLLRIHQTKPIKFYIASKLENAAQVSMVAAGLKERGHIHAHDWTAHGSVQHEGQDRLREVAGLEMQGVVDADLVIALLPGGRGTHVEIGMAIALGKPVILCAEHEGTIFEDECAFYTLCIPHVGPSCDWVEEIAPCTQVIAMTKEKGACKQEADEEEISTLKAERDALLKYVPPMCELCKYDSLLSNQEPCASCPDNYSSFIWRGLEDSYEQN